MNYSYIIVNRLFDNLKWFKFLYRINLQVIYHIIFTTIIFII